MASVLKREGRPGWYVKFTDATGRKVRKHVPAATKAEAKRIAYELERKAERQVLGLEARATDSTMKLAELCRWWLKHHCPKASSGIAKRRLERHVCSHPLGNAALSEVTTQRLEELLADQRRPDGTSPAPATINRTRTDLHSIFERARKAKLWTGPNPMADVEARRVNKRAYATLRAEEVAVLLPHVDAAWRNLFAAALWTGLRKGELCGLLKSDVDLRGRIITAARSYASNTTKGGHADAVPIAEPLVPYLEDAMKRSPSAWVFPAADGSMRTEESDPQKVLHSALIRAARANPPDAAVRAQLGGAATDDSAAIARGFIDGWSHVCRWCKANGRPESEHTTTHGDGEERRCANVVDGRPCGKKLWPRALPRPIRFHDLRHSTATLLLRAKVDPYRVQRILRHSSVTVTTGIYGHLVVEDLREAINTLPAGPTSPTFEPFPMAIGGSGGSAFVEVPKWVPKLGEASGESSTALPVIGGNEWVQEVSNLRPLPCQGPTEHRPAFPGGPASAAQSRERAVESRREPRGSPFIPAVPSQSGAQMGPKKMGASRGAIRSVGDSPDRLLRVSELAGLLRVSTATVYAIVERGELEHLRVSNAIRVTTAALERYLAQAARAHER